MKPIDIINIIEKTAIPYGAADWDNCGVQIAGRRPRIRRIALALDPTLDTVERALAEDADFILTHHPLTMKPRELNKVDDYYRIVAKLLEERVWLFSAHTSLDANPKGPVNWLAQSLELTDTKVLEPSAFVETSSFAATVPQTEIEKLATQCTQLAGVLDCATANGVIRLTVEPDSEGPIKAYIANELDESPIFLSVQEQGKKGVLGFGCIGNLPYALPFQEFSDLLASVVDRDYWIVSGEPTGTVHKVAYCTGSGSGMADAAFAQGADVYITGDVKYHSALDTIGCMIDVGHFSLEEEMMRQFALQLAEEVPDIEFFFLPAQDPMRLVTV